MRYLILAFALCLPLAAHAGNIKDTDLITSNTFFLPPSAAKTVFIQARNSSDNEGVSLTDLGARLTAKGYQIIQDPSVAHYILLANIVYCNITKPEMPVENIVAGGYGSGTGSSIMGGLQGFTSMASMRDRTVRLSAPPLQWASVPLRGSAVRWAVYSADPQHPRCRTT